MTHDVDLKSRMDLEWEVKFWVDLLFLSLDSDLAVFPGRNPSWICSFRAPRGTLKGGPTGGPKNENQTPETGVQSDRQQRDVDDGPGALCSGAVSIPGARARVRQGFTECVGGAGGHPPVNPCRSLAPCISLGGSKNGLPWFSMRS